ncbi:hypothetical protein V8E51_004232 [Hyaloscypha variabilis]
MLRQALQRLVSTLPPRPPFASSPPDPMPNQLQGIPAELLQNIARYLSLSSSAALALSSRFILAKLGNTYFVQLKEETLPPVTSCSGTGGPTPRLSPLQQEREDFLILLDRDLRDTIYCYYCRTIHDPMDTLKDRRKPRREQRACTTCEGLVAIHHHIHNEFCFARFQMIMKKSQRFGMDCSAQLQKLSRTCTYYSPEPLDKLFTHQVTTYARVVSGCLLLRTIHWLLFEWEDDLKFPKYNVKVCSHIRATKDEGPANQRHLPFIAVPSPCAPAIRCVYRLIGPEVKQCQLCPTDFKIEGAECGPLGRTLFALRVSVWQDFGDCSSLYDPNCKHTRAPSRAPKYLGLPNPYWSIKEEFEDSCPDVQKLSALNVLPRGLYLAKWRKGYRTQKSTNPGWWQSRVGKYRTSARDTTAGGTSFQAPILPRQAMPKLVAKSARMCY